MNICPECAIDVIMLGANCFELLTDCIDLESQGIHAAIDVRHMRWRLHRDGTYRMHYELQKALQLLEGEGYLISTEISQSLVGIAINREGIRCENDFICWCTNNGL